MCGGMRTLRNTFLHGHYRDREGQQQFEMKFINDGDKHPETKSFRGEMRLVEWNTSVWLKGSNYWVVSALPGGGLWEAALKADPEVWYSMWKSMPWQDPAWRFIFYNQEEWRGEFSPMFSLLWHGFTVHETHPVQTTHTVGPRACNRTQLLAVTEQHCIQQ